MLIHELLGIKYPIIQGGMTDISDGKFAATSSNAGILGIIGAGEWDKKRVKEEIDIARSLTKNPFGINIMMMSPYKDDIIDLVIEEKIKVVTVGASTIEKDIKRLKENGIMVFPVLSSVSIAKRLERYGIDGVIAEGCESGGHVGNTTTMALLPQMVEALSIPVIAAGGIANGKQLNACLMMGASGIQIGTVLLASNECQIHKNYKDAILNARDNDTVVIAKSLGAPVRVIKGPLAKRCLELEKDNNLEELSNLSKGALERGVYEGDSNTGVYTAGQIAGLVHEIKPINKIIEEIIRDAVLSLESITSNINKLKEIK